MANKDTWITVAEAAKQIGMSAKTLNTYRCLNKINGKTLGPYYRKENRRILYSQKAVKAYIKKRREDDDITGGQPA